MKTTKEFPATHSMSTEWFVADEDGNIAILSFNENGPVPVDIPEQSNSIMMTDHNDFGQTDSDGIDYFEFTDEQANEMISKFNPISEFSEEDNHGYLIQLSDIPEKRQKFISTFKENINYCFSHKYRIYYIDYFWLFNEKTDVIESRIKLIKELVVSYMKFDSTAISDDDIPLPENYPIPFYVYRQPYYTEDQLAERTFVPKYPFKENQIVPEQRKKLLRVPLKFKDCSAFQIAQYVICGWLCRADEDEIKLNGRWYSKFHTTEGESKYFLVDQKKDKDGEMPIFIDGK